MKVYFWQSKNLRVLSSRRGKRIYRSMEIRPGIDVCEYVPLPNSVLELYEKGYVVGTAKIDSSPPAKVSLASTKNLEEVYVESETEDSASAEVIDELEEKTGNSLQPVGDESTDDAATLSGSADVQVSSVAKGDDGLDSPGERRSESGSDGLHSDDDGMDVSQDRSGEEVNSVSSSDEDS